MLLLPPISFVKRPVNWLRMIDTYGITTGGGPNLGYDLCLRRVTDEQSAGLDLSRWTTAVNGAEPVRAETMDAFAERFASTGFRREAFYPCYGLAEATLLVSGGSPGAPALERTVDSADLEHTHRARGAAGQAEPHPGQLGHPARLRGADRGPGEPRATAGPPGR